MQVKQKLPLKLATKQGNSSTNGNISNTTALTTVSNSHVTISSPFLASSCGNKSQQQQQQILPWKLRESNSSGTNVITGTTEIRRSVSGSNNNTSCYERLISAESSNVALLSTSSLHSRTESSPAMMQNIQVMNFSYIYLLNFFIIFSFILNNSSLDSINFNYLLNICRFLHRR